MGYGWDIVCEVAPTIDPVNFLIRYVICTCSRNFSSQTACPKWDWLLKSFPNWLNRGNANWSLWIVNKMFIELRSWMWRCWNRLFRVTSASPMLLQAWKLVAILWFISILHSAINWTLLKKKAIVISCFLSLTESLVILSLELIPMLMFKNSFHNRKVLTRESFKRKVRDPTKIILFYEWKTFCNDKDLW